MDDKFKYYYSSIDLYNDDNEAFDYCYDSDPEEVSFFKSFNPIKVAILMRYLNNIIKDMCKKLITKEEVQKEINYLKNAVKESKVDNIRDYKWKDISLIKLLKGELSYLNEKFIFQIDSVPDNDCYINNYTFPNTTASYNFSIKELYHVFLERGINIAINNYYLKQKG